MRLLNGGMIDSHLMFAVGAMLFVRSFVEVDVITPYVVGSFLLYYAAGVLSMRPVERMSGLAVGTGNRRESAGQFAPPR
jgi:exopolysaccharide production protein ExoQ